MEQVMVQPEISESDLYLHIDQLILDGIDLPPAQREELLATLQIELTQLLSEGGLHDSLAAGGAYDQLSAAPLTQPGPYAPAQLGRQIAQSVYGSISG
jgi:hypothetical protein